MEETCLEKVNQIRLYSGERYECVDRVEAGEVCVILGLSRSYAGMTLGDCAREEHAIIEPVLSYEVIPPEGCAPHVLLSYMRQLEEEDPTPSCDLAGEGKTGACASYGTGSDGSPAAAVEKEIRYSGYLWCRKSAL